MGFNVAFKGLKTKHICVIQDGAKRTHVFETGSSREFGVTTNQKSTFETSYSRRSESFYSRRNCNCATRNVSICDAEL